MTRKQLPKVIRPTAAHLPVIAAEPEAESQSAALQEQIEAQADVRPPSALPANDPLPATTPDAQWLAERRLREAFKIVGRHRMFAAAGGLLPMPAVTVVGITAIILRMVKALGDLYGVPFERDQTHSIVLGLMGGAAPAETRGGHGFNARLCRPRRRSCRSCGFLGHRRGPYPQDRRGLHRAL